MTTVTKEIKEMEILPMKTMKDWTGSGILFSDFCPVGSRVDDAIHEYWLEVLPPLACNHNLLQCSEPCGHPEGKATYTTLYHDGESWIYYGELTEAEGKKLNASICLGLQWKGKPLEQCFKSYNEWIKEAVENNQHLHALFLRIQYCTAITGLHHRANFLIEALKTIQYHSPDGDCEHLAKYKYELGKELKQYAEANNIYKWEVIFSY